MTLTAKKQKKLTRWVNLANTKQNTILMDMCIQYFIIFCVSLFSDRIAYHLQIRVEQGLGPLQILVCLISIGQMYRYSRLVER